MALSQRQPATNREWLVLLLLISLTQYVVTSWVEHYGADPAVVSHVSFAGTIVSIILAVLAIVYSYYQSFSQQRDSQNSAGQVEALRHVVEQVRDSRRDFSTELDRFAEISQKLDTSIGLGERSHSAVERLAEEVELLKQSTSKARATRPGQAGAGFDLTAVARRLLANPSAAQLAMYLLIQYGAEHKLSTVEVREQILIPAIAKTQQDSGIWNSYTEGMFTATWFLLIDLDLLRAEVGDGRVRLCDLNSALGSAIGKAIADKRGFGSARPDVASVQSAILDFEKSRPTD